MGRPKGSKNKPKTEVLTPDFPVEIADTTESIEASPSPARVVKSELDRKLDYFTYPEGDAKEAMKIWEYGEDVNPLKIPKEIQKKYGVNENGHPVDAEGNRRKDGLRFRWTSNIKWDKKGKNYAGWHQFHDKSHPDGVKRGNDLFLTVLPENVARRREEYYRKQSTDKIKELQERAIERIEEIETAGFEAIGRPDQLAQGIMIGERPKVGKGGGGQRGLQREMIAEIIAKNREKLAKNRKYFT